MYKFENEPNYLYIIKYFNGVLISLVNISLTTSNFVNKLIPTIQNSLFSRL